MLRLLRKTESPILSNILSERSEERIYREIDEAETMEIYYKGVWITMDDFTGAEWDDFENFEDVVEQDADDVDFIVDAMMTSEKFHDEIVGWF